MEYLLLLVIIFLLFHLKSTIKTKTNNLSEEIKVLNQKLNETLRVQRESTPTTKKVLDKPIVQKPVAPPSPKPVVPKPPIVAEKINPTARPAQKAPAPIMKETATGHVQAAAPIKKVKATPKTSSWIRFKEKNPDLEKFIGENLINKIGILILVLGISYFVKFAIDKNWINEPARVGIGILAGGLVLFIAHKLRQKYAAFSSVLVAGSIAIFYFTIAIAFHEYQLFNQTIAFSIMVIITAFSCLISLSYNRIELAILALIGGFAVPFMISTGSGNYLVLFSYIVILDIGILAMAYFKKWPLVNLLAFVFTTFLFGGWLLQELQGESPHFLGALIFGFVFYLIFVMTSVINNLRTKGTFPKLQLSILSINTFVFYGVGMLILTDYKPDLLGLFTAFVGLLNLSYALLLYRKFGLDKTAVYLLIGLTLTFITLSIPVQFSGNNITIFWAAEAVLLMWLSQISKIKSYSFAAVFVQLLMFVSLIMDWPSYISPASGHALVLNPIFITGITAIASYVGIAYLLRNQTERLIQFKLVFNPITYKKIVQLLAVMVAYFVGLFEVIYQANAYYGFHAVLAITLLYHLLFTGIFCFILGRKRSTMSDKLINVLAIVNVLAFAFLFAKLPFWELQDNIEAGLQGQMAYNLHLVSLIIVVYLCYLVYQTNKKEKVFALFNYQLAMWGAIFLLVHLASTEIQLLGVHIMDLQLEPIKIENASGVDTYEKMAATQNMIAVAKQKVIKTGLPVLWGILAFLFLIIGIKKQLKQLRIIALTLLGVTIVKLFLYDISNVSETGKIVAFILLGILVLVISFVYQKLKGLVIDKDKTPTE